MVIFPFFNLCTNQPVVVTFERGHTSHKDVHNHTTRPDVTLFVILLPIKDLRGHVKRCAKD